MSEGKIDLVRRIEFQPGSMEAFAMQKVVDLEARSDLVLNHSAFWRNVESILRRGAYSEDFAKRIRDDSYERDFHEHYNQRHVSLGVGELGAWPFRDVLILVDPEKVKLSSRSGRLGDEALVKRRIKPTSFLGLQLLKPKYLEPLINLATQVWKENPENSLPIYGPTESAQIYDLVWPKHMPHKEIVQMLAERKL